LTKYNIYDFNFLDVSIALGPQLYCQLNSINTKSLSNQSSTVVPTQLSIDRNQQGNVINYIMQIIVKYKIKTTNYINTNLVPGHYYGHAQTRQQHPTHENFFSGHRHTSL